MHPTLIYHWRKTPLLLPLLGLISGIIIQEYAPVADKWIVFAVLTSVFIQLFYSTLSLRSKYQGRLFITFAAFLLFSCLGLLLVRVKDIRLHQRWIGRHINATTYQGLQLTLEQEPIVREKTVKLIGSACYLLTAKGQQRVCGKVIVYVPHSSQMPKMIPGDYFIIQRIPTRIVNAGNPGEMNRVRFYLQDHITHRVFLKENEWRWLHTWNKKYGLTRWLSGIRQWLLLQLKKYIPDENAAGLAAAILMGYRQELDDSLNQSYINTGVVHIIAISGMHLALLGWLLQQVVSPLQKNKAGTFLAQLILVTVIWLFSLLAGATPSVLRAALLYTVLATGVICERKPVSLNTLCAAAFILLLVQPLWLWDLGFQLSFMAVLSILLFGKPLLRCFQNGPLWAAPVLQLIAVSIAAQLLTLPFTLYYFHQFPASFLLSNSIAVPLSTALLYTLLALCILAPVQQVASVLGWIAIKIIQCMNVCIQRIEKIPGLLWTSLHWSWGESLLLFVLILSIAHWLLHQSSTAAMISLLLSFTLLTWQYVDLQQRQQQKKLIIYNSAQHSLLTWIEGKTALTFTAAAGDTQKQQFLINPCLQYYNVKQHRLASLQPYLQLGNYRILQPQRSRLPPNLQHDTIAILWISRQAPYHGEDWFAAGHVQLAILDGTLGKRTRNQWRSLTQRYHIPYYDMQEKGAFVHCFR